MASFLPIVTSVDANSWHLASLAACFLDSAANAAAPTATLASLWMTGCNRDITHCVKRLLYAVYSMYITVCIVYNVPIHNVIHVMNITILAAGFLCCNPEQGTSAGRELITMTSLPGGACISMSVWGTGVSRPNHHLICHLTFS